MVMQRRHEKYPPAFTEFFLRVFEIGNLQDHGYIFDNEYSAKRGYQQFLPDSQCEDGDNTTQGQASRVAHEHLCRIRVIPEESQAGPHKCRTKDYEFRKVRDVHDVEVITEVDT